MSAHDKRTDSIDELVSALVDGELSRESARFLMRRLEHEPTLVERFGSYHTIRACLKREPVLAGSEAFVAGIWARLDGQAAAQAVPARPRYGRWLRAAAGGAIAAGMAAVALLSLRAPDTATLGPVAATPAALRPVLRTEKAAGRFQQQLAPDAIESYMMRHSGAVASMGGGNAPFVYATALPRGPADPNVQTVSSPAADAVNH
jgi:sigma-E factor negative regulatory protein RseA